MMDAGVTVVLSKLQEVATAEVTALLKVDDQIRNLRRGLVYLQAEVRGADQQRHGLASELLLLWAREARAVTFDVEDAVDEFHLKVEAFQVWGKPGRQATWYASAVKMLNGLAMQFFVRHGLSREISKINERIEEISKIKRSYNIESTPTKHWSLPSTDADVVWDIEDGGPELRQREFKTLKQQILSPPPPGKWMPGRANNILIIHGESGTGKTRLARRLYNDHEVREKFEVFAWICLPPRLRFEELSNMVLEKVRSQVRKKQEHAAMDTLSELLRGRRYLVVLDGLVDVGNWNSLQLDLLAAARGHEEAAEYPGTRPIVLVTTQLKEKEILKRDANQTFKLGPLDANQTFRLFHERIAGGRLGADEWNRMCWDFNGRILGVTRGLPLAVVVLGGVLRTKAFPSEWKEVFAGELETAAGEPRAVRRLWLLALEELPSHLKSCFLYLATAPENVLLDPARLVRLWVAEGFVAPSKGRTLEEVGLGYLGELVGRGLVEVAERDYARGAVTGVTVHGLLHGFVQAEAQESGFLDIHHNAGVLNPHAVRRLAIHNLVDSYVDTPDGFPKLRSLLCDFLELEEEQELQEEDRHGRPLQQPWHKCNPAEWLMRACGGGSDDGPASKKLHQLSIIRGSRFLRVIDLYGLLLGRVPDEIGGIIHLRYLGIRNCNLSELPASISRLDNLQTLDLRKTLVGSVTDDLWDIRGLRHVLADALSLPTRCPAGHLKQLQTLTAVTMIAPGGCCPLNHMLYLRSLAVSSIPDSAGAVAALLSALRRMESLVSLSLSGSLVPSGVLSSPSSRCLRDLALHGKLDSPSPSGPFILPNLGKLTLSGSDNNLGKDFVKKLAELPNLAEMELLDGCYGEAQLVLEEGGFPSLAKLTLNNLAQLEVVRREHGSAPELVVLTHSGCNNIKVYDNSSQSPQVSTGQQPVMQRPSSMPQRMTATSSDTFDDDGTTLEEEVIGKEKVGDEVGNEEPEEYNQRMEGTNSEVKRSFIVTTDPEDEGHNHSGVHHRVRIRRSAPSYDDD